MRVLVVEDSIPLADVVAEGLRAHGMAVDVAYDGTEAAFKLTLTNYHVVVLDRTLPGLAGDELCGLIARKERRAMVLMVSGAVTADDRVSGLQAGADDYLGKPFYFPELVLRVRALANRQHEVCPLVLRHFDVELDPVRHTAFRDGRSLDLSAKEFGVLETLMRTRALLSAEELLEQVWDEHADPFTRAVPVTMSRLRQKLGPPEIIETVPRVGYRLASAIEGVRPRPSPNGAPSGQMAETNATWDRSDDGTRSAISERRDDHVDARVRGAVLRS